MAERSQIFVKVDGKLEVANFYMWNYGTRMISRARYGIEWIREMMDHPMMMKRSAGTMFERFRRIWDVNFDCKDIAISEDLMKTEPNFRKSLKSLKNFVFGQDNDDGILLVDIDTEKQTVKYCFADRKDSKPMDATVYMLWNCPKWRDESYEFIDKEERESCRENIRELSKTAQVMTREELKKFAKEVA